jgi:uncharacterized protein (DUF58 family)
MRPNLELEYGVLLSAALSFLMLRQNDAVGLQLLDAHRRKLIPGVYDENRLADVLRHFRTCAFGKTRVTRLFGLSVRIKVLGC